MLSHVNTAASFEASVFCPKITERAPNWEAEGGKQTRTPTRVHTHTHTAITLFSGESSLAAYKWTVVVTQSTVVKYCSKAHQLTGTLILLRKRDVSKGFEREQSSIDIYLVTAVMMACTPVQQWLTHCTQQCST